MKIIFINRFFFPDHSATSQMLSDLAFYLVGRGWSVEVVTSRQKYEDPTARLKKFERLDNVAIRRVSTTSFGRGNLGGRLVDAVSFYVSTFYWLIRETERGDVLVAKTDPPLISVVATLVAKLKSARLMNWVQDLFPEVAVALNIRGISGWRLNLLKKVRNWSWRQAEVNVLLGSRMRDLVAAELGDSDSIRIIPNWADASGILPLGTGDNPLLDEWGLRGKFVVGYSGNMGRAHQFETILEIAEKLKGHDDIVFLFIGGGANRAWIEEEADRRALGNVMFKEYQPREKLSQSLSVPDLHLISLNPDLEGLIVPSKFYGIAAAGRPMLFIGDENGEIARMIKSADCGASVIPGDADSAMDCILRMKSSPEEAHRKGRNARDAFTRQYSMNHAFDKWEAVLSGYAQKSEKIRQV